MYLTDEYIAEKEAICIKNDKIEKELYDEFGVKKGLRDQNGNGVLAGLTNISKIISFDTSTGEKIPCDGKLWYRGYRVEDLINDLGENELGYEKMAYLLLLGEMPGNTELKDF